MLAASDSRTSQPTTVPAGAAKARRRQSRLTSATGTGVDQQHAKYIQGPSLYNLAGWLLYEEYPVSREPIGNGDTSTARSNLRPLRYAARLLNGDSRPWSTDEDSAIYKAMRRAVYDWYYSKLDEYGWMRVPCPDEAEFRDWLSRYCRAIRVDARRVIPDEELDGFTNLVCGHVTIMWPVVGYVVLLLSFYWAREDRILPNRFWERVNIEWRDVRGNKHPTLVLLTEDEQKFELQPRFVVNPSPLDTKQEAPRSIHYPLSDDLEHRVFKELAMMLLVDAAGFSEATREILAAKLPVGDVSDEDLKVLKKNLLDIIGEMQNGRSALDMRYATGRPLSCEGWLKKAIRNSAMKHLARLKGLPFGATRSRWKSEGFSVSEKGRGEIAEYSKKKEYAKQHRGAGAMTLRQLSSELHGIDETCTYRRVRNALEAELKSRKDTTTRPQRGLGFRLEGDLLNAVLQRLGVHLGKDFSCEYDCFGEGADDEYSQLY